MFCLATVPNLLKETTYKLPEAMAGMSRGTKEPMQLFGSVALFGTTSRGCKGKTWSLRKSSGWHDIADKRPLLDLHGDINLGVARNRPKAGLWI